MTFLPPQIHASTPFRCTCIADPAFCTAPYRISRNVARGIQYDCLFESRIMSVVLLGVPLGGSVIRSPKLAPASFAASVRPKRSSALRPLPSMA